MSPSRAKEIRSFGATSNSPTMSANTASILHEWGVEAIVQRRRDNDRRPFDDPIEHVLGLDEVRCKRQVGTVFFRGVAKREDDDRIRREDALSFWPADKFQKDRLRRG
jgi:hypothetical protein